MTSPSTAACIAANDQARADLRQWFAANTGEAAVLGAYLHAAATSAHPAAMLARLSPAATRNATTRATYLHSKNQ